MCRPVLVPEQELSEAFLYWDVIISMMKTCDVEMEPVSSLLPCSVPRAQNPREFVQKGGLSVSE